MNEKCMKKRVAVLKLERIDLILARRRNHLLRREDAIIIKYLQSASNQIALGSNATSVGTSMVVKETPDSGFQNNGLESNVDKYERGVSIGEEYKSPAKYTEREKLCSTVTHLERHTENTLDQLQKSLNSYTENENLRPYLKNSLGELFNCEYCGKIFEESGDFKRHLLAHNGEKDYKCDQREKPLTQISNLKAHTGKKSYNCDICNKLFSNNTIFKWHLMSHSSGNLHQCEKCEKSFREHRGLKTHLSHCVERPFKCDQCEKSFPHTSSLIIHLKSHNSVKPYKCNQCSRSFSRYGNLKLHQPVHIGLKPYKCNFCTKAFSHASGLKLHARTHIGENLFKCDQCEKSFFHRGHLNSHLIKHNGERPYKCNQCGRSFSYDLSLREHILIHLI